MVTGVVLLLSSKCDRDVNDAHRVHSCTGCQAAIPNFPRFWSGTLPERLRERAVCCYRDESLRKTALLRYDGTAIGDSADTPTFICSVLVS